MSDELKKRWLSKEGKILREKLITHIREDNWHLLFEDSFFAKKIKNERDLAGIDLSKLNLSNAKLKGFKLRYSDFNHSNLTHANLWETDLRSANLSKCMLTNANLVCANLWGANLSGANLDNADLFGANFNDTDFTNASLKEAILSEANFCDSHFYKANLTGAEIKMAYLTGSDLREVNLSHATLWDSRIRKADLSGADLTGADLSECSLVGTNLIGANLNGCNVYGTSIWDIETSSSTIMKDLTINRYDQPLMTVDDIEVAQFIYTIINNKKIAKIINTLRTKTVLILGSFDRNSLVILDSLKDVIRSHYRIPLLFDFNAPATQDLMETVKTLALLSSFVIVDLSVRSGQLHELASLVRDTYIPFVTIAREGTQATAMHSEFRHFYWYRSEYFTYPADGGKKYIPQLFRNKMIPWVSQINNRLNNERRQKEAGTV